MEEKKKYYKTKVFKELREKVLKRDGYKCVVCDRTEEDGVKLVAHHRNYKHFGLGNEEELKDMICLCTLCHSSIHRCKSNFSWFSVKHRRNTPSSS